MARKKEPKPMGRPPVKIDIDQLEKLGAIHATTEEVAAVFGCTKRTILNRFKDEPELKLAYENGKEKGKLSLRRLQWRHASGTGSGAVNMTIHLSKHWLKETDKAAVELSGPKGGPIETRDVSPRELITSRIASIAARRREGGDTGGSDRQSA
ncbi:hypothetical protein H8A95_15915 [Bradyrhizobium sp. Pear76]|uniref:hypothetical protein n=1 Tax=Bradyrhizobium oropedii TaxID=1571201 RepID=UPI001E629B64|nr:hypothetical protein [Bradyrhizobium oropedii]MCC8963757.1 hypothetical protein [Bradyrhizobium oropedii]